jgi:hypothetical protein
MNLPEVTSDNENNLDALGFAMSYSNLPVTLHLISKYDWDEDEMECAFGFADFNDNDIGLVLDAMEKKLPLLFTHHANAFIRRLLKVNKWDAIHRVLQSTGPIAAICMESFVVLLNGLVEAGQFDLAYLLIAKVNGSGYYTLNWRSIFDKGCDAVEKTLMFFLPHATLPYVEQTMKSFNVGNKLYEAKMETLYPLLMKFPINIRFGAWIPEELCRHVYRVRDKAMVPFLLQEKMYRNYIIDRGLGKDEFNLTHMYDEMMFHGFRQYTIDEKVLSRDGRFGFGAPDERVCSLVLYSYFPLLDEGYLKLGTVKSFSQRFFTIVIQLPTEIRMLLCHVAFKQHKERFNPTQIKHSMEYVLTKYTNKEKESRITLAHRVGWVSDDEYEDCFVSQ